MHRRFLIQLYNGTGSGDPRVVTGFRTPHLNDDRGWWRCSGCLMRWSNWGNGDTGRPLADGCGWCKRAIWIPDNPTAELIDKRAAYAPAHELRRLWLNGPENELALAVMRAVELAIEKGHWCRVTHTCRQPIQEAVQRDLEPLRRNRGVALGHPWFANAELTFEDADPILKLRWLEARQGTPWYDVEPLFTLRYRWVQ